MKSTPKYLVPAVFAAILCLLPLAGFPLEWNELDPFDENSSVGKGIRDLTAVDGGEWGSKAFPLLADEIYQKNIVRRGKKIAPLTPYQLKWLGPQLQKWGLDPAGIHIVYGAALLNNYKIFGRWPVTIMDEYEGQTFGRMIYIRRPYRDKDGSLLVLLSHEAYHVKQYREAGSIAEFGRQYVTAYLEAFLSYRNNRLEKEAYRAEAEFRDWLCTQEGWRCD
jgi:hypothetical protein